MHLKRRNKCDWFIYKYTTNKSYPFVRNAFNPVHFECQPNMKLKMSLRTQIKHRLLLLSFEKNTRQPYKVNKSHTDIPIFGQMNFLQYLHYFYFDSYYPVYKQIWTKKWSEKNYRSWNHNSNTKQNTWLDNKTYNRYYLNAIANQ